MPERRFAGVETARFSLLGRDVRVARVRGAAQMERLLGSFGSPCVALAGDRGPGVCRRMRSWVVTMRPSYLHMSVLRERMLKKDFR